MDPTELYHSASTAKGIRGVVLRSLKFLYTRVTPYSRNKRCRYEVPYWKYLNGTGDVLMLGSNLPPSETAVFGENRVVQIDIKLLEYVDFSANAEDMRSVIEDASFSYIVSTSMLEHTPHPWRVVKECHRTLKPGGMCYFSVPWMVPLHEAPHDYFRYSIFGLRSLFSDAGFEIVESGSLLSGHDGVRCVLHRYFADVLSFGNRFLFIAFEWLFMWILWPLELIEMLFKQSSKREFPVADSMLFLVARKPAQ